MVNSEWCLAGESTAKCVLQGLRLRSTFSAPEDLATSTVLSHWAAFVDEIDDATGKWLLAIAPFAEEAYNSSDLLENLSKTQSQTTFGGPEHMAWDA